VPAGEGAMLAVIGEGLELAELEAAITGLEVDAANHNSPSQIVLSGKAADVERAGEILAGKGRRSVPLNVSAPFHSRFMRRIEPAFAEDLSGVAVDASRAPKVASNYSGSFHPDDAAAVRSNLVRQISGTVRWVDDMRALAARAGRIIEIGPGRPLSGFFRELGVTTVAVRTVKDAERALRG